MLVTRRSPLTGEVNQWDLPVTKLQMDEWEDRQYRGNRKVQEIFPNLSADQREFILTGYTPDDWEKMFSKE